MPAYVIVQVEISDPVQYEAYKKSVSSTIEAYGGRYLVRGGAVEALEGDWDPGRLVILEFPTAERAKAWWSSEEYREPRSLRHRAARSRLIVAEGV